MKLTWEKYDDPIFGAAYDLIGLPGEYDCGNAHASNGRYVASASIGGRFLSHNGKTLRAAIKYLNAEIDKRSIGLLGVDYVEFVHA